MTSATGDWVGLTLDQRYRVTTKLGQGGMGFVFRAHDARLDCDVVLKVPRAAMLEDPDFRARFEREVRALVKLAHPHVVKVSDFGQHEGVPFAVMQYLPGGSLSDRRPRDEQGRPKPVAARTLSEWLPAVAGALDFIHKQGYIHRDVKPANILFDAHRNAYVSDFGVAKAVAESARAEDAALTGAGTVLGTASYMAPELVTRPTFDGRIDQYALAVTVYELLCGQIPFAGEENVLRLLMRRSTEPIPTLAALRPGTPAALSDAVARALAGNPDDRFADCASFARAVEAAIKTAGPTVRTAAGKTTAATTSSASAETPPTPHVTKPLALKPSRPDRVFSGVAEVERAKRPSGRRKVEPASERGTTLLLAVAGGVLVVAVLAVGGWLVLKKGGDADRTPITTNDPPLTHTRPTTDSLPPDAPGPITAPAGRLTAVRASVPAVTLAAGAAALPVEVTVERGGDEPVQIELELPPGVTADPSRATLAAGVVSARFALSASADAFPPADAALRVVARRGAETADTSVPLTVTRHDFRIQPASTEVTLRPGVAAPVEIAVDRAGGYRGPLSLSLDASPLAAASAVTVPYGGTAGTLTLTAKPGAPPSGTLRVLAKAADGSLVREATVAVRVHHLTMVRHLAADGGRVTAVAFAPNATLALTGGADGTVRLWDLANGEQKWSETRHKGPVRSLAFSADSKQALAGGDDHTVTWWPDVAHGDGAKKRDNNEHSSPVWKVYFAPGGTVVDTPDDGPAPPRPSAPAKGKARPPSGDRRGKDFTLPALTPVSHSAEKVVYWDPKTNVPYLYGGRQTITGTVQNQKRLALDAQPPDVTTRVPADAGRFSLSGLGGDTLQVFNGDQPSATLTGNGGTIRLMALSANGRRALTLGDDGQLRLWDVPAQQLVPGSPWRPDGEVTAASLSPDGAQALLGGPDGARLWKLPP